MLKKLRLRFITINMCLVSIVLFAIFFANAISTSERISGSSYAYLENQMRKNDLFEFNDKMKGEIPNRVFPSTIFYMKFDIDNNLIIDGNGEFTFTDDEVQTIVNFVIDSRNDRGIIKEFNLRYIIHDSPKNGLQIGFIDISYEQSFLNEQIINYLIIGFSSLIIFFFISFYLSKITIKPVAKAFMQQQQFISDASHELKTPITVIMANASIILKDKSDKKSLKWVCYIEKEAKRMKKLVEDLMFLARLDEENESVLNSKINLSDVLFESVLLFEPVAFEAGLELENLIESDIFIKGNIDQIKRLILILLDNACKYSEKESIITIRLIANNGKAKISISNLGKTIPSDEIKNIFDRFYRVDKSRQRNSNSYGLGLSMAKRIVEFHKGDIYAKSNDDEGTTFSVVLSKC